jgi:large subunit ribosomal protein L21
MYAVIESGGKQYRVELGSVIELDRLEAAPGTTLSVPRVLLVADGDQAHVGRPLVDGASVRLEVVGQTRGEKVVVFKYRPKARHRAKQGHRQELTRVRVADITLGDRSAANEQAADTHALGEARLAAQKRAAEKAAADRELAARLSQAAEQAAEKKQAAGPEQTSKAKASAARSTKRTAVKPADAKRADAKPAETKKSTSAPKLAARSSKAAGPRPRRATKKDE